MALAFTYLHIYYFFLSFMFSNDNFELFERQKRKLEIILYMQYFFCKYWKKGLAGTSYHNKRCNTSEK